MVSFFRRWGLLAGALLLTLAADGANWRQVFDGAGGVDFVDADCYSRMTRVREVCAHPGEVIRRHAFENYPFGTRPHTTIPFDYAVYALRMVMWPFCGNGERALDLAGAWVSPLLGLLTVFVVWLWMDRERLPGRACALLVLSASPILAHGFALGRPDHQSLIVLCMAGALAAEWTLWRRPSRGWGVVSGVAWAVGLWTSLYEPAILLAAVAAAGLIWNRPGLRRRERWPGLAVSGVILLTALWIEGWRIDALPGGGEGGEFFEAWSRQIGELASLPPWSPTLFAWVGWGLVVAPILLLANCRAGAPPAAVRDDDFDSGGKDANANLDLETRQAMRPPYIAFANVFLLLLVWALTCWQVRWGYFLPLVYALGVPSQFGAVPMRWRRWLTVALLAGLWPMAADWWTTLHLPADRAANLAEQRRDAALLRETAAFITQAARLPAADADPADADDPPEGILAPWWLSPALAYHSGQPALAGSSHESLPGTVDVDRFYLAADAREAAAILRRRRVRWVVAYEPDRVLRTAAGLFGQTQVSRRAMGFILYEKPEIAPRFLRLALVNPFFKVYEVRSTSSLPAP